MRKLIIYFLVLLLAVWSGLKIAVDPGYLLIAYRKTTIEMPLWLGIVAIIVLFTVIYSGLRFFSRVAALGKKISGWSKQRRRQRAWQLLQKGLLALSAGEWQLAEKELLRIVFESNVNYLYAARAAHAQKAFDRRDHHLGRIQAKDRLSQLALGLTQVRSYLRQGLYEQSLAILQQLQHLAPKHAPTLQLLKKIYCHLQDWAALEILLPALVKYTKMTPENLDLLSQKIYRGLLATAVLKTDNSAELIWQRIPADLRTKPMLIQAYLPYLIAKSPETAEKFLQKTLEKDFTPLLIADYGSIVSTHPDKQLHTVEQWLTMHPQQPELLLTLGRLCLRHQLWGKARSYFEASAALKPRATIYYELGKLAEQFGESAKAMDYYRQGLTLAE